MTSDQSAMWCVISLRVVTYQTNLSPGHLKQYKTILKWIYFFPCNDHLKLVSPDAQVFCFDLFVETHCAVSSSLLFKWLIQLIWTKENVASVVSELSENCSWSHTAVAKLGMFLIIYWDHYRMNAVLPFPDAVFGCVMAVL